MCDPGRTATKPEPLQELLDTGVTAVADDDDRAHPEPFL